MTGSNGAGLRTEPPRRPASSEEDEVVSSKLRYITPAVPDRSGERLRVGVVHEQQVALPDRVGQQLAIERAAERAALARAFDAQDRVSDARGVGGGFDAVDPDTATTTRTLSPPRSASAHRQTAATTARPARRRWTRDCRALPATTAAAARRPWRDRTASHHRLAARRPLRRRSGRVPMR